MDGDDMEAFSSLPHSSSPGAFDFNSPPTSTEDTAVVGLSASSPQHNLRAINHAAVGQPSWTCRILALIEK